MTGPRSPRGRAAAAAAASGGASAAPASPPFAALAAGAGPPAATPASPRASAKTGGGGGGGKSGPATGGGGGTAPAPQPPSQPATGPPLPPPVAFTSGLPARVTATRAWAAATAASLEAASWLDPEALPSIVPSSVAMAMVDALGDAVKAQPTVVDVDPHPRARVVVVGDTHGHVQDVAHMLRIMGPPGPRNVYVFNGDFVDRGAWGLETLLLLTAWRLAAPDHVVLLRGNHESVACTTVYGFLGELLAKYGPAGGRAVWRACTRAFAGLPLAAVVGRATLVCHGGLWRAPPSPLPPPPGLGPGGAKRRRKGPARRAPGAGPVSLGSLAHLRAASKGGVDPSGRGTSALAADVLWSDPAAEPGLAPNEGRGVGLTFGPDVTDQFLAASGLRLILRSHEGPDARDGRAADGMAGVLGGYAIDHDGPAGRLATVFSAPDYPMFAPAAEPRYANLGAVAVLSSPSWADPAFVQYAAAPRPARPAPYYELDDAPDSDEDVPPGFGAAGSDDEWGVGSAGGGGVSTGGGCSLLDGGGVERVRSGSFAGTVSGAAAAAAHAAAAAVELGDDADSRPATRRRVAGWATGEGAAGAAAAAAAWPPSSPPVSPAMSPLHHPQGGPHHPHAHPTRHPASPRAGGGSGGGSGFGGGRPGGGLPTPPAPPPPGPSPGTLLFTAGISPPGPANGGGLMGGAPPPPPVGMTARGRLTRGGAAAAAARAAADGTSPPPPPPA